MFPFVRAQLHSVAVQHIQCEIRRRIPFQSVLLRGGGPSRIGIGHASRRIEREEFIRCRRVESPALQFHNQANGCIRRRCITPRRGRFQVHLHAADFRRVGFGHHEAHIIFAGLGADVIQGFAAYFNRTRVTIRGHITKAMQEVSQPLAKVHGWSAEHIVKQASSVRCRF